MKLKRRSILTGKMNAMDLPVTQIQLDEWIESGRLIQVALPMLTADQREFLLTGATPEEWDAEFLEDAQE